MLCLADAWFCLLRLFFLSIVDIADACFKAAIINMFQELKKTMIKKLEYNNDP